MPALRTLRPLYSAVEYYRYIECLQIRLSVKELLSQNVNYWIFTYFVFGQCGVEFIVNDMKTSLDTIGKYLYFYIISSLNSISQLNVQYEEYVVK